MPLNRETIITLGSKLAPAAITFGRLRNLLRDPYTEMESIVDLVRLDPALTFHVIRLSNSVLFGLRERNNSLEGAVGRVGFNESYRLVGFAATNQVCQRDLPTYRLKASRLWENVVATAAAAEVLALPASAWICRGRAATGSAIRPSSCWPAWANRIWQRAPVAHAITPRRSARAWSSPNVLWFLDCRPGPWPGCPLNGLPRSGRPSSHEIAETDGWRAGACRHAGFSAAQRLQSFCTAETTPERREHPCSGSPPRRSLTMRSAGKKGGGKKRLTSGLPFAA